MFHTAASKETSLPTKKASILPGHEAVILWLSVKVGFGVLNTEGIELNSHYCLTATHHPGERCRAPYPIPAVKRRLTFTDQDNHLPLESPSQLCPKLAAVHADVIWLE